MSKSTIKKNVWKILLVGVGVVAISIMSQRLSSFLDETGLKEFTLSLGVVAPIVFAFLAALSNIIPPIPAIPFWLTSFAVFGIPWGPLIMYFANVLGNTANYLIARWWGRHTVIKLAGKDSLKKIEEFSAISDVKYFFLLRIFGGIATDYASYAAGIAKMNFAKYILSTAVGLIPMMYVGFVLINMSLINKSPTEIVVLYLINYFSTLVFVPLIVLCSNKSGKKSH